MDNAVYINYFSVENFRKFKNEIKLDFTAENKKYELKETINIFNFKKRKKYYNSALGIIGQNTAGKTTILNALNTYIAFNAEGTYPKIRELTPIGFREKLTRLINEFDFNDQKKPLIFKISICNSSYEFVHIVKFFNSTSFHEEIYLLKNKKMEEIHKNQSINNNKLNFLKLYLVLNSQQNENIGLTNELIEFGKALRSLINSTAIYNFQNTPEENIQQTMDEILFDLNQKKDQEKIKSNIEELLKILDDEIKTVNFIYKANNFNQRFLTIKDILLKNGSVIPIWFLSAGTLKGLSKILAIFRYSNTNDNSYVFIDELDNSWHPKLAIIFIKMFQKKVFKNNVTLIFTAHNPYIFNTLRKDAIYFFDNNSNFIRLNEYKDKLGKNIRNDYIFSKNYFDSKIGSSPNDNVLKDFEKLFNQ